MVFNGHKSSSADNDDANLVNDYLPDIRCKNGICRGCYGLGRGLAKVRLRVIENSQNLKVKAAVIINDSEPGLGIFPATFNLAMLAEVYHLHQRSILFLVGRLTQTAISIHVTLRKTIRPNLKNNIICKY